MPKAAFEDFIKDSPNHKALINNADAKAVFDILNGDERIYEAIKASENMRPALEPSIKIIENYIKNQIEKNGSTTFPLDVEFNRQAVGRFQQTILARFGYKSYTQKVLTKSLQTTWFRTASCYKKLNDEEMEHGKWRGEFWKNVATMKVVVKVTSEEI